MEKEKMREHMETDQTEGCSVGRHPDSLGKETWEKLGVRPIGRTEAIREKCIDCCAGNRAEVRRCGMIDCVLWPFRMGTNPFRAPPSAAKVAAGRALSKRRAATKISNEQ